MLTEVCNYLKNWFSREDERYIGVICVSDNVFFCNDRRIDIADGQYFRIIGSILSDGVYKYGVATISDEDFDGAVWLMRVPPDVVSLADDIAAWVAKYGGVNSEAMSPFNAESFGGYSYSKSSGSTSSGSLSSGSWQSAYASRLARYRKL